MATSSFFYGGSTAPEQNTVDELIDALNQKVSAADQDRVAAEQARDRAETAASNAELSESNVAGLSQQAQETLAEANEAVAAANAAVAGTATNAATATTKAAEAASSATAADASADAALVSQNAAAVSATNAATSASTASTQASAAATSATNAASSASSAAGSATTATTQATNASNSATAAAGSASAASTSATNAASSASSASTSATAAASSASSASASATSASGSASTATTKASEAAASATAAATSASNAATSATSASGSASTATTQATNASNSATAAAASASSASTSATNASNSATAAGTSATNAASSATAASGSATAAAASAAAAQAAQTAAEAAFDSFDDRYLGAKTVAPTTDNDGNALLTGALYFNSTGNQMYAWSGSTWVATGATATGDVVGPASSTDNAIARFDGTTGKLVQNSTATVSDTGDAVFKSVNFNDPVHGSRTLSMSSGRLVVDGDFDTVGTYRFGNGWCSLSGGNADGVTLAQLSNGTGNFVLQPNSTGIVETRSGTNPTTFRIYNTFTDASNFARVNLGWVSGNFRIQTTQAGTGSSSNIELIPSGGSVVSFGTLYSEGFQVGNTKQVLFSNGANYNQGIATESGVDGVIRISNGSTGRGDLRVKAIDATGPLTVNGNNISAQNSLGFRNRIINGDMRIDQRNNGASVTPAFGDYTVDRWALVLSHGSQLSAQRSTVAPSGFQNSLLFTSLVSRTLGAGDFFYIAQFVEGFNAADLGWGAAGAQSVTLSFRVRSSLTGTFVVAVRSGSDDAAYPATYTINAANTWETKTITIPGPTSGTFSTGNGRGFGVWFSLGAGSSFNATANTWGSGSALSVSGSVNLVATNGATLHITGVQLEAGSVATPFERRDYGRELIMCQRYFQRFNHFYFRIYQTSGAFGGQTLTMPVVMRASPTLTRVGTWAVANCNQPVVEAGSGDGTRSFSLAALWTANSDGFYVTTDSSMFITASAEL